MAKYLLNLIHNDFNFLGGGTAASSALALIRRENMPLIDGVLGKKNIKTIIFILTDGKFPPII